MIIIAGYPGDINKMLDTNPGLKSRFTHFFEFPDWTAADCVDLIKKRVPWMRFRVQKKAPSPANLSPCTTEAMNGSYGLKAEALAVLEDTAFLACAKRIAETMQLCSVVKLTGWLRRAS